MDGIELDTDGAELLKSVKASEKLTLTMKETATLLGVDPRTVSQGIKDGTIPAIQLGRRQLIPRAPLLRMLTA